MPIIVLKPHIANQIAAGEVVERPASIVKELTENALDAGATQITIEIENGGLDLIRISDNGCGISYDDASNAFLRHATSKISVAEDLTHIQTYGFRGEALPSIAAVASVEMHTKRAEDESGTCIRIKNGDTLSKNKLACTNGTSVEVRELFAGVPARLKFLKSPRTEAGYIADFVSRLIMASPQISFSYISNGRTVYRSVGDGSLENTIYAIYGIDIKDHLLPVSFDDGYLSISGFIGDAEISRPNRTYQSFLLNGRYIRSNSLSSALMRAYETKLMSGRFPFAVLDMHISGYEIDVNVHPAKLEVRFADEQRVIRSVTAAAHKALLVSETPDSAISFSSSERLPSLSRFAEYNANDQAASRYSAELFHREEPKGQTFLNYTDQSRKQHYVNEECSAASYFADSPLQDVGKPVTALAADFNTNGQVTKQPTFFDALPAIDVPVIYKTIGCAFDTYWLIESGEDLLFIDQHAAHERIIYEQLVEHSGSDVTQPLLIPMAISLTEKEKAVAEDCQSLLSEIGIQFAINDIDGSLQLTAMPVLYDKTLGEPFFRQALEICSEEGILRKAELLKGRLSQCACKHAVKAGDRLSDIELSALLHTFQTDGIPMTCPHGRPVMICLKKRELEKLFKRIL